MIAVATPMHTDTTVPPSFGWARHDSLLKNNNGLTRTVKIMSMVSVWGLHRWLTFPRRWTRGSKRNCTLKHEQTRLVVSGLQRWCRAPTAVVAACVLKRTRLAPSISLLLRQSFHHSLRQESHADHHDESFSPDALDALVSTVRESSSDSSQLADNSRPFSRANSSFTVLSRSPCF